MSSDFSWYRMQARRIPKRLWGLLQNPAETHAMTVVRKWATSGSPSLVMHGGLGCGKTFAALWAVASHENDGAIVRAQWLSGFGNAFAKQGELSLNMAIEKDDECSVRINLRTIDLLLIDDVGSEMRPDAIRAPLQELLDQRLDNDLRTIITTNLGMEEFGERYGAPMMSRIKLGGIVSVAGEDLRTKRELRSAEYVAPSQEQPKAEEGPMVVPAIVEETLARWKKDKEEAGRVEEADVYEVYVDGRMRYVIGDLVSHDYMMALTDPGHDPHTCFAYKHAAGPDGVLNARGVVRIRAGTVFNTVKQ